MADQSTVVEAIDTTSAENSLKLAFNVEAVKKVATVHVKLREMASRFSSSSKFREILLELSRRAADLRRECYSSAEKSEECVTIIVDEIIPTIREGDDDDDDDLDELSVELNEKIEETKIRTDRNLDETKKVIAFADQISTHRHVKEEERDRVRMKETIEEKHSIAERSAKETEKSLRQAERETTHSRRNAEWAEETSSPVYMFLFKPFLTVYKWHHEKKAYASDGTVQDLQKDLVEEERIAGELKAEFKEKEELIKKISGEIEIAANEIKDLSGQYDAQADFWKLISSKSANTKDVDRITKKAEERKAKGLKTLGKVGERKLKKLETMWRNLGENIRKYSEALGMDKY
ncbi:uncharacterized protein [Oscarella lobularis]|uniref:uncharacterized protein n=1 Tax=Oscarella lobularis TaxID=121494 RepID=UPI0033133295